MQAAWGGGAPSCRTRRPSVVTRIPCYTSRVRSGRAAPRLLACRPSPRATLDAVAGADGELYGSRGRLPARWKIAHGARTRPFYPITIQCGEAVCAPSRRFSLGHGARLRAARSMLGKRRATCGTTTCCEMGTGWGYASRVCVAHAVWLSSLLYHTVPATRRAPVAVAGPRCLHVSEQ